MTSLTLRKVVTKQHPLILDFEVKPPGLTTSKKHTSALNEWTISS